MIKTRLLKNTENFALKKYHRQNFLSTARQIKVAQKKIAARNCFLRRLLRRFYVRLSISNEPL